MLQGKKILLGVCGSIAAYKAAILTRLLIKEGAEVKIVMTSAATEFITPLTLSTLSNNPVIRDFFDAKTGQWESHVELGLWADLYLIAPISANSIAHFARGICENMLSAIYLSARCPVMIAPAMDLDMYQHPSTQQNLAQLKSYGNIILETSYGELASGLTGYGRMAEPEEIVQSIIKYFDQSTPLAGKKVLITAGPTQEAIDPVRFIGNHSSGKMGFALAREVAGLGARVTLVSGPTQQVINHPRVELIRVTSAEEMYQACLKTHSQSDIAIFSAAVADYAPVQVFDQKLKKGMSNLSIELRKNVDIAFELGKNKKAHQFHLGFALETDNELNNAYQKLISKNFDLVALNSLNDPGAGFIHETNKITIINKDNKSKKFELKNKEAVASDIVNAIISEIS
ncbi:MAG: bifunctional phosphopantothenoylcysteine decarboxylase/phosphopantothenate--cysteine ligase CoaBC [Candidatus Cyclobacteriaceae bacterium M3_2C_046]